VPSRNLELSRGLSKRQEGPMRKQGQGEKPPAAWLGGTLTSTPFPPGKGEGSLLLVGTEKMRKKRACIGHLPPAFISPFRKREWRPPTERALAVLGSRKDEKKTPRARAEKGVVSSRPGETRFPCRGRHEKMPTLDGSGRSSHAREAPKKGLLRATASGKKGTG